MMNNYMDDLYGLEVFSKDQFLDYADAYEEVDKRSNAEITVDPNKRLAYGIPVGEYVSQNGKTHSVIYMYDDPPLNNIQFDLAISQGDMFPEWEIDWDEHRIFITYDYDKS